MSEQSRSLSREIRAVAQELTPVFAAFESICLDVGRRLAEAVPSLSALSQTFAGISEGLQEQGMIAATRDLKAIASELARYATTLADEERDFLELVGLNQDIALQVGKLQVFVRTLGALVFTMKIEAAQLPRQSADMVDFANTLQRLAEHARVALDNYGATQARLDATLRHSASKQGEFKSNHLDRLTKIAHDILDGLDTLSARRGQAAAFLRDVALRSRSVGDKIGECVVGLQIGDSTRQRVEHVAEALQLAADALAAGRAADYEGDVERLAAGVAELQRRQVEGAQIEFAAQADNTADLLLRLTADLGQLEGQGVAVFGGGGEDSFLEALARQLGVASDMVHQGIETRADVDAAKASVVETMDDLQTRTRDLVDMAAEVSMIGTNASLRSTRLGDSGRGINLVAAELRGFGRQIHATVQELPPALARVVACIDRFSGARAELEASGLARLNQRMGLAIESFSGAGRQMSEALRRLGEEASRTQDELSLASRALSQRSEVANKLEETAQATAGFVQSLGGAAAPCAQADRFIDQKLGPAYSMTAERRIHHALTGAFPEAEAEPEPPAAAEAEAFML